MTGSGRVARRRRLALAAALALAALALWRHRGDRGPRVDPEADVDPVGEPRALTALAWWVPSAPRHPLARLAARIWAAPLSALGLGLAAASATRPRPQAGALVAAPADRGAFRLGFTRRGFRAVTLGHVILAREEPDARLLAHELVHVRQAERLGPLMALLYPGLMPVYGYARHPMERAARRGARAATATP